MGIPKSNLGGVTRIPKLFWGLKKQMTAEFQQNSSMILNGSVSKHPHDQLHVQGVRKNDDLRDGSEFFGGMRGHGMRMRSNYWLMMNIQYLDRLTAPTNFENRSKVEKSAKEFFCCVSHPKTIPLIEVFVGSIFVRKTTILMNLDQDQPFNHNLFSVFFGRSRRAEHICEKKGEKTVCFSSCSQLRVTWQWLILPLPCTTRCHYKAVFSGFYG